MHDLSFVQIYGQRVEVPGALIIDGTYLVLSSCTTSTMFLNVRNSFYLDYEFILKYVMCEYFIPGKSSTCSVTIENGNRKTSTKWKI